MDVQTIHIADQISQALKEVFAEHGVDVGMDLPQPIGNGMGFMMDHVGLPKEEISACIEEAIRRVGLSGWGVEEFYRE